MSRALVTALSSMAAAQMIKFCTHYSTNGEISPGKLFETGGMPSSHASGVTALATYVALDKGVRSTDFGASAMLGLVVMYDAMGIRRHAGKTAIQVNDLDEHVEELAGEHPGVYHWQREQELKENLGHQPEEVLGGALLGLGMGFLGYFLD